MLEFTNLVQEAQMKVLTVVGILFLIASTAIAQEEEVTLEDIFNLVSEGKVVTATKTERLLKTAPQAVTVITRKQIDETGASTIGEALRFIPGMNIRMTPMGGVIGTRSLGPSPFTERVLLLIDGTPYNSPDKGGFPGHPAYEDFFPIEHIKRIEVIKGPGSALYGQNAFFGIVNIITEDFREKGTRSAIVQGGSRDTGRFALSYGDAGEDWNYSFTGKYKTQRGPMDFDRTSDINSGDAFIKTNYRDFSLSYLLHKDDSGSFLIDSESNIHTVKTHQTLNVIDAGYNHRFSENWSWRSKAFFNRRDGNTCESCHNPLSIGHLNQPVQDEDEVNQRLFFNTQFDWIVASHKVIFGADVQSDKTDKEIVKRADADETVNTVAAYAQGEFTLADGKAILTAGVRIDHNEITDNSISPSISAVFLPTTSLVLRTSYGRAFRQPTWNDLFIDLKFVPSPDPPDIRMIGNPNLDTEKIDTFEAGAEYFFNPQFSLKGDFFYNRIQDFIEPLEFRPVRFGPTGPVLIAADAQNRDGNISSVGFDLEARIKLDRRFTVIAGYSYQSDDLNSTRTGLDSAGAYSPEHKLTGLIAVEPVNYLSLNFSYNFWSEFNSRNFDTGTVRFGEEIGDPYTYANFKAIVRVPVQNQHLNLAFTVKNLFDEEVQLTPAFGVDQSLFGREYYGSVSYDF
jgi:iron complex outermembrane receptor protein